MAVRSNPLRSNTGNQPLRPKSALFATHHINICITTTANNDPNCSAKSAHQLLRPIIVIKNRLKPNITARIATAHCSAGKPASTSSSTNAATITAPTVLTLSNNSTRQNKISDDQDYHNSNSVTFTANTCSKPKILLCHRL